MPPLSSKDEANLLGILDSIEKINRFISDKANAVYTKFFAFFKHLPRHPPLAVGWQPPLRRGGSESRFDREAGEMFTRSNNFLYTVANADEFFADEKTFDAVLMNFVVIGESVAKLSDELKETYPDIPWTQVKRFRNIIAHHYFGVDAEEVWQIIHHHLEALGVSIRLLLAA